MESLFMSNIPAKGDEEVTILQEDESIRIERIISNCYQSPAGFWYDQEETEWVSILEGEAVLLVEDNVVTLRKGDCLTIQKHQRHRVQSTNSCCIWLCVFWK